MENSQIINLSFYSFFLELLSEIKYFNNGYKFLIFIFYQQFHFSVGNWQFWKEECQFNLETFDEKFITIGEFDGNLNTGGVYTDFSTL